MAVERIPLHSLPSDVMKNVLRIMDGDQLISYSLISRDTKQNVIDLKIKLSFFTFAVNPKLEIDLTIPKYYFISLTFDEHRTINWNPEENDSLRLDNPGIVEVKCLQDYLQGYKESLFLENRGLSVREWILHFFDIFHHPMISSLHFSEGCNRFDVNFIREVIKGLNVIRIVFCRLPMDYCYKLMMEIDKLTKNVMINSDQEPVEYFHRMVIQNTENTVFHSRRLLQETIPFRIDDVLANNSENIIFFCTTSVEKDLNRFLKLWIKGSNPRLKYLLVGSGPDLLAVMKGIRYRVMGPNEQRQRPSPLEYEPATVAGEGAFVIRRKNGVEATVNFRRGRTLVFVVWN